jgi:hypothetical protein
VGFNLMIYPNPSRNGVFEIQSELPLPYTLEVLSMEGKILRIISINEEADRQVRLQDLNKGIYIIRISKYSSLFMRKLIIG